MKVEPAEAAHELYDTLIDGLFKVASVRGKKATTTAMLLYGAWASIYCDNTSFEKRHHAVDPWEADVCLAFANMLMRKSGNDIPTIDQLKGMFDA